MGEVYLAEDTKLQRPIALKLLTSDLSNDSKCRQRFMTEARAASALNHPNVCVIYEVGETEDLRPYLVMEYVDGLTLDALLKKRPLAIREVVDIGLQIADALNAAHARGIVHRDLKPANICVNERGQVKVLDFGLAKRTTDAEPAGDSNLTTLHQTLPGQVMGTPSYMSPEQAMGMPVDHRSDTFSLGIVLYQLTTRQLPFHGANVVDVAHKIVHSDVEPMIRLNSQVPVGLEHIVCKCLEKDPADRFQVPNEIVAALKALLKRIDSEPETHSQPPGKIHSNADEVPAETLAPMEALEKSDIFINCALIDDQPFAADQRGWVSQLQRHLEVRLGQLWGEPLKIGRYPMPAGKAPVDDQFFDGLAAVKTLISVLSPPFVKSEGCQREVMAFCEHSERTGGLWVGDKPRLLKVVKTPVDQRELPAHLSDKFSGLMDFEFFEIDPQTGRLREFDEAFGPVAKQRFFERIYDLAHELCLVLKACQSGAAQIGFAPKSGRTIFLAETTSDLKIERDKLRRELMELGHRVLPEMALPLNRDELEASVREYLKQSHLAVHLIGSRYGFIPEGAEESIVELQNHWAVERVRESDLRRLIWIPKNRDIAEERQQRFVRNLQTTPEFQEGAELIEGILNSLKSVLIKRLEPPREAMVVPKTETSDRPPHVYLLCDPSDEEAASQIEDLLFEQGIEVSLPDFEAGDGEGNQHHRDTLCACDAVLLYFGEVRRSWVETRLRDLLKAPGFGRKTPFAAKAVYVTPGEDPRKQRFRTHLADVIRPEALPDKDSIRTFIDQVKLSASQGN